MARMTPEQSQVADFGDRAVAPFRNTWPVAKWLLDEVAAP